MYAHTYFAKYMSSEGTDSVALNCYSELLHIIATHAGIVIFIHLGPSSVQSRLVAPCEFASTANLW